MNNKTKFLKSGISVILGAGLAGVLYAQLSIPTNIDNAEMTIKKINLTVNGQDGTAVVSLDGSSTNPLQVGGSAILGSYTGTTKNTITNSNQSSVLGGIQNDINSSNQATIVGGVDNNITNGQNSVIQGGNKNTINNGQYSAIAGGQNNKINANYGFVAGGNFNIVNGLYGFAGGQRAVSNAQGTFVWADTQVGSFTGSTPNSFVIRAAGGVAINTATPTAGYALTVAGSGTIAGNLKVGVAGNKVSAYQYCDENGANCRQITNLLDSGDIQPYTETDPTVNTLAKATLACTNGQVAKYNGTTWACAADAGLTSYTETDPGIGTITANYIPKQGPTTFLNSLIYDNGTNVGIGTTNPNGNNKLEVEGTIAGDKIITNGNNVASSTSPTTADIVVGSNAYGGTRHDSSIMFWSSSSASRILSQSDNFYFSVRNQNPISGANAKIAATNGESSYFNGNVGIGTTSPQSKLHVMGNVISDGYYYKTIPSDDDQYTIKESQRIDSTSPVGAIHYDGGNVGINSANPSAKLEVNGDFKISGTRNLTYTPANGALSIQGNAGGRAYGLFAKGSAGTDKGGFGLFGASDALTYYYIGNAYNAPTMIVQPDNGNVGIGLTYPALPTSKLHVVGDIRATSSVTAPSFIGNATSATTATTATNANQLGGQLPSYYVDTASTQTIGGTKTFSNNMDVNGNIRASGSPAPVNSYNIMAGSIGAQTLYGYTALCAGNYNGSCNGNGGVVIGLVNANATVNIPNSGVTFFNGGNVGIGITNPTYKLQVIGDVYANGGWLRTSGDAGWYNETYGGGFYMVDSSWVRLYNNKHFYGGSSVIRTDGELQVGGNGSSFRVTAGGVVTVASSVTASAFYYSSDKTLKKDLKQITNPLEKINQLNGYNFTWKKDNTKDIGVIAQEVEKVFPDAVKTDDKGLKSVKYGNLIAPVIEAIKELYTKYVDQQKKIDLLEQRLETLEALVK